MRHSAAGSVWPALCALVLVGCAQPVASADPFGCGIVVSPEQALIGGGVTISRPAAEPSESCTTLAPGTTQTIELRSIVVDDPARGSATTVIEPDGSFEVTMPLPVGIRLGVAVATAIPPAESDCTAAVAAAGMPDECYFPRAQFTVAFDSDELSPVRLVSTDAAQPAESSSGGGLAFDAHSYAQAGPGPTELTLVIYGSGCASRPTQYRHDAPPDRLEIVSEVIVPDGQNGCNEPLIPWTTVIEVPDGYRHYSSVHVDNLDTVLIG